MVALSGSIWLQAFVVTLEMKYELEKLGSLLSNLELLQILSDWSLLVFSLSVPSHLSNSWPYGETSLPSMSSTSSSAVYQLQECTQSCFAFADNHHTG